jgi:hypothetical protein
MPRHHPGMATIRTTPEFIDLEHPDVARALLRHMVDGADIVGEDLRGRGGRRRRKGYRLAR